MTPFLKKMEVSLDDQTIQITQLSGLHRYDFIDYCAQLPIPESPGKLAENATEEQLTEYENTLAKSYRDWQRFSFVAQSRLVAYGCLTFGDDLQTRHQYVMESMTPEQVKQLHDEIAKFSGMPLPEDTAEDSTSTGEGTSQVQEPKPADPKA